MIHMDEFSEGELRTRSFEEHFRPDARSDYNDLIMRDEIPKEEPKKESKPKKGKNIVELLTGGQEIGDFARQMNLDPEMAEKMLVPLLSLLDKYGVGETVTASPRMEQATNAFEVIRDVAPVIKGAAEFISGRRNELESTDLEFLERIKESQGVTDASLFDDDDDLFEVGETVVEEPVAQAPVAPPAPALDLNSFSAEDWGNFFTSEGSLTPTEKKYDIVNNELTDALDAQHNAVEAWARQEGMAIREKVQKEKQGDNYDLGVRTDYHNMELGNPDAGVPSTFAEVKGMNTDAFAIVDVSDLAQSQGLSMNEIMEADSQRKINNQANEEWETEPIDVSEIVEDKPMVDYSEMEVPEDAQKYDPMEVKGYDLPDFDIYDVDLEGGEDV